MKLPAFIPDELRQLVRFVPLRGWDAVEWRSLLSSMRLIGWRYVSNQGVRELQRAVQQRAATVTLVNSLTDFDPLAGVCENARLRQHGDNVLRMYFSQWLVDEGMFIDLRAARFGVSGSQLAYSPNGLWVKLRPEFRRGMIALYRSFYHNDDTAFEEALMAMGMLRPGLSDASRSELKELLHRHFGVEQRKQRFSIDKFKSSFDDLFEFFIANDYTLHSDFVFVGFYLITLYLNLEQGGQQHDVQGISRAVLR